MRDKGLFFAKKGNSVREFKGVYKKNLCKFNNFLSLFRGGFYLMDSKVALNSNVMSPVSKNFGDGMGFIKIVNLFFDRVSFCLKGIKGGFKNASTSRDNYGGRLSFPEDSLKVCIKSFNLIRQRFMGVGLGWFRIVFKNFNEGKRRRKLKFFNRFSDVFISIKGCFSSNKNRIFAVRTLTETMKVNIFKGFPCNTSFLCWAIGIYAGNNSSCFFNTVWTYELNSIHRRFLCFLTRL